LTDRWGLPAIAVWPVVGCIILPWAAIIAASFHEVIAAMKKAGLLALGAALTWTTSLLAQQSGWPPAPGHVTLPVWPGVAPGSASGSSANLPAEADMTTAKDNLIAGRPVVRLGNVSAPTLTLYNAESASAGPAPAVVVFPGGGYNILAIDLEGTEVCGWLNSAGINCVLLKYRVPNTGPYPKSAAALQDAQRALGLVRQHATEWGIDPKRVGVLGFAVIVYPGYLALADKNFAPNPEINPTANTPPTFIVQAEDDPVHVENAVVYFLALKNAKVPAELHIYAQGGHGYGLRRTALPVTTWPQSVEIWLHTIGILPTQ
jgi:acetyl esterase/lipase